MRSIAYTLVSDGSSDRVLCHHIDWLIKKKIADDVALQSTWADLRTVAERPTSLENRIETALDLYPCDLLVVHRDVEKAESPNVRHEEIKRAIDALGINIPFACVVPMRMQEAWLLFHEAAIRIASGNPNGKHSIELPSIKQLEKIPDPKAVLDDLLRKASSLKGRRLRKLNIRHCANQVAEFIDDFSPLLAMPSFARLKQELDAAIDRLVGTKE